MKWNIKKSDEIKLRIAKDEALMKTLSSKMEAVFEKHKIKLGNKSYLFEPRVFMVDPEEIPSFGIQSREALTKTVIADFFDRGAGYYLEDIWRYIIRKPFPGIPNPALLEKIERLRVADLAQANVIRDSIDLTESIIGNKKMMAELSSTIFDVLQKRDFNFADNEGCIFVPIVTEKPVYAQKVARANRAAEVIGFGPQIVADPTPEPIMPVPGIIEVTIGGVKVMTPGVIAKRWWWVGIPAPEMLKALDVIRQFG